MSLVGKQDKFAHLFSLFCELDDWARKHGVKLFLDWGTLLGAVRHRGFIPWDFDLGVGVKWDDYVKLLKAWEEDPLPRRDIVNIDRYEDYPALFSRFVDCDTTEIRVRSAWNQGPCGMSIDIFPLIPLPASKRESQKVQDAMLVYYELKNPFMLNKRTRENSMKRLLVRMRVRERIFGRKSTLRKLERIIFSTPAADCSAFAELTAGARKAAVVPREYLESYVELPFEGRMCYVPEKYIEYLQMFYGVDWRNYPENRSGGYHYVENLQVPYDVYVEDYMQFLDRNEILETMRRAKRVELTDVVLRPWAMNDYYRAGIDAIVAKIDSFGSPDQYADAVPLDLEKQLMEYYSKQTSGRFTYWGIWGNLSDDWLSILIDILYRKRMYYQIMKIVGLRSELGNGPIPKRLSTYKERIEYLFDLYNAMDYRDVGKVKELATKAADYDAGQYMQDLVEIFLMREALEESTKPAFLEITSKAASQYPDDDYIAWHHAFALANMGKADEAETIWRQIEDRTNNGMIMLAIEDDRKECSHGCI